LNLSIEPTPLLKVMVGNGSYMQAEGHIKSLIVNVQGQSFELVIYLLPISGANLIVGADWLSTIGPHIVDYISNSFNLVNLSHYRVIHLILLLQHNSTICVGFITQIQLQKIYTLHLV